MRARLVPSVLLLSALGCTPSSPATDAGADTGAPDTGPSDVDAGGCATLTGAYTFTGSCSTAAEEPIAVVCIDAQTASCGATVEYASFPPAMASGDIAGTVLTFGNCTLHAGLSSTLHCTATGGSCNGTGNRVTYPGATSYCCQPGAAASGCASGERCTIVTDDPANTNSLTACVPVGSLAEGATCTRNGGRVGSDDCGAGLFCANTRQANLATRVCQRLCQHEADCHTGENCVWLGSTPPAGVCTGACTIGGTDCPTGTTCRTAGMLGPTSPAAAMAYGTYCHQTGTAAVGGACTDNTDCGPNLTCPGTGDSATLGGTCRPTCDTAHPCATGTCVPYGGLPNPGGGGFCGT